MSASDSTRLAADVPRPSPFISGPLAAGALEDRATERERVGTGPMLWSWIGMLALTGFAGLYPQLSTLWETWTTDPLRSIGIIILPTSIFLMLHLWRESKWELRGSWWGLLPVTLAFAPLIFGRHLEFFWVIRGARVNFIPSVLPVCLYVGGILWLFAGPRVLRRAWFPLVLLLCIQPVPDAFVRFLDLPLQEFSARTARSFAGLLGFSASNNELLRLMFTPNFGMFIAPGCDGMRGAITLGYGALILGYLRRLSLWRWAAYVAGALMLGHLFNLIRLCALVLYYRAAVGHTFFENAAKQADYVIGATLFCLAASLFWISFKSEGKAGLAGGGQSDSSQPTHASDGKLTQGRAAALALLVLVTLPSAVSAMRIRSENLTWAMRQREVSTAELNGRMPAQIGAYKMVRVWQEQQAGALVLETAVFEKAPPDEIELGIWMAPSYHSIQQSLMTHGEVPKTKTIEEFGTAGGRTVQFNTALYDDGITDTLTGDTYCSPTSCESGTYRPKEGVHIAITKVIDHTTRGKRVVPIFFKLQVPHTGSGSEAVYNALSSECQGFLSRLDLTQLSQSFQ